MEFIKKICSHGWSVRHQFAKYFIVGFTGYLLNLGLLIFAKEVLGISAVVATAIIGLLLLVFNFVLNKYWSFKEKTMPHKQVVRYLILVAVNYVFSIVIMYFFHELLKFDYRLVNFATTAIMVAWNFPLYKYWVYK